MHRRIYALGHVAEAGAAIPAQQQVCCRKPQRRRNFLLLIAGFFWFESCNSGWLYPRQTLRQSDMVPATLTCPKLDRCACRAGPSLTPERPSLGLSPFLFGQSA
jgi:hypothetical protein